MCGIVFCSNLTPSIIESLPFMCWDMMNRGVDSFGFSNGYNVWKWDKSFGAVVGDFMDIVRTLPYHKLICHTRGASVGEVNYENAHPFVESKADNTMVIGIHNGGVSNWEELNKQYSRDCKVDSNHIFKHIAEDRSMEDICGYGTVVWTELPPENAEPLMYYTKFNQGDLHVCHLKHNSGDPSKDLVVGCSVRASILKASAMWDEYNLHFYEVPEEKLFRVEYNEVYTEPSRDMKFGYRYYSGRHTVTATLYNPRESVSYRSPHFCYRNDICPACSVASTKGTSNVVCDSCIKEAMASVEVVLVN